MVRDLLLVGNALLFGVILLLRAGSEYSRLWDGTISNFMMVVPVVMCFAASRRARGRVASRPSGWGPECCAGLRAT